MASYQLPPPPPMALKGDVSTNWKDFEQAWNYYYVATELKDKDKSVQAATLCSVIGRDTVKIMNSLTTLTGDDKKDPTVILEKLRDHFVPQKHLLFERRKFLRRNQGDNETIDQYVIALRQAAESCEYEALCEGLIRDRLLDGTTDQHTADRLLNDRPVPDLNKCADVLRAAELSRNHKREQVVVEQVHASTKQLHIRDKSKKFKKTGGKRSDSKFKDKKTPRMCKFCAQEHIMNRKMCPAFGKKCGKCGKENHIAAVCKDLSRKVHSTARAEDFDSDDSIFHLSYVNEISSSCGPCQDFMIPMNFHGDTTSTKTVQLDSGATCDAMSRADLLSILGRRKVKLQPAIGDIKLYDKSVVTPLGRYTLTVSRPHEPKQRITFDILEDAPWPIISGRVCLANKWMTVKPSSVPRNVNTVRSVEYFPTEYSPLEKDIILKEFQDVFTGLGCLPGEYHIDLDPSVPPVQHVPRRVPVPLKAKLLEKLQDMEKQGIIKKVDTPTDWISSLVAVQKPSKLRICIDPRDLNRAIRRPKYQMPTVDELLPKLADAKVFSVLDAKDGFFQVKLDEGSSYLTTFWTPAGRYRYLRMPQGISSAPEEYQRRQTEVLDGLSGVAVIADDILCYGSGSTMRDALIDHDQNFRKLMERARQVNLKFNKAKLRLRLPEVSYMGHLLTSQGLRPDPAKVMAVSEMPRPDDKKGIQRVLGCVQYLSKFMPALSEVSEPLRRLTEKDTIFVWGDAQEKSFNAIKQCISSSPVLKYYDVNSEVTVQSDASQSGLGATLLQNGQPVAFASRSLTRAERNYAQIEKECLAIVFACCRFDQYLHGRDLITVESDHKPLVPIFQKPVHSAPKRLQRMLLRLQKYNLSVKYLPGTQMYISDMLSRAYLTTGQLKADKSPDYQIFQLTREQELYDEISAINQVDYIPLSPSTHAQVKACTSSDITLQSLMNTVMSGWPDQRDQVPVCIREYWTYRDELTVQDGVLFKGQRVIIPTSMRKQMIARVHASHLGQDASVRRARDVLFWPGMGAEIRETVSQCPICSEFQSKQQKEPLMTPKIPTTPWSKVAQDLFSYRGENYAVTVDYYSDYFELDKLEDTLASTIVELTKRHFARHGIADMITDNGPQYTSEEFATFAKEWNFNHDTSSPLHSQSNGKAESAVKIAKMLIKKASRDGKDIYMSILEWRNTPAKDGYSPVQKLYSRRTRTSLPTAESMYAPSVAPGVRENIELKRQKTKLAYDQKAKPLPELQVGESIRLQPQNPKEPWSRGACLGKIGPRSYLVQTENGSIYRRNRKWIRSDHSVSELQETSRNATSDSTVKATVPVDEEPPPAMPKETQPPDPDPGTVVKTTTQVKTTPVKTTRSGRAIVKPQKLKDFAT